MRVKFVCRGQVTSNNGIRRAHLVADDGKQVGDMLINIPFDWFENGEEPREGYEVEVTFKVLPSKVQRS